MTPRGPKLLDHARCPLPEPNVLLLPERELDLGQRHPLPPVPEQVPERPPRLFNPLEEDPLQH